MPQARIRTSTSPGPGSGSATSCNATDRRPLYRAARNASPVRYQVSGVRGTVSLTPDTSVQVQIVEPDHVAAQELLLLLDGDVAEVLLDELLAARPGRVEVRVVRGPDQVVGH